MSAPNGQRHGPTDWHSLSFQNIGQLRRKGEEWSRTRKGVQMRRMDVGGLQHLAHMHLEVYGEGGTGRGPRGMVYAEGPHKAGRRWRISIEREKLYAK